jgi:cytochrome c-type biogenesis protein CcmE
MTRKQRRAALIAGGLALGGLAVAVAGYALRQNVTFFMSPTDVLAAPPAPETHIRLGGLVEEGSVHKANGVATFRVTDRAKSLPVLCNARCNADLPELFKEGQGAIAEGVMGGDGTFLADKVLAKHDERYMPPEVAAALKKSGYWQEKDGKPKAAKPGT